MKNTLQFSIVLIFLSCKSLNYDGAKGLIKGKISIEPICPVETNPPLHGCKPTLETFKAYQTAIYSLKSDNLIMKIEPDIEGNFEIELAEGSYYIHFEDKKIIRIGGANFPIEFKVTNANTTQIEIHIDTGIR